MYTRKTASRLLVAFTVLLISAGTDAQLREIFSEEASKTLPLSGGGAVFIESFSGSISVTGTDGEQLVVVAKRVIKAAPGTDISQVQARLGVIFEGNASKQTVRSVGLTSSKQLTTRIDYEVKVPRTASVNMIGGIGDAFKATGLNGRLFVRSVSGRISIDRVSGPIIVDSVNADVIVTYHSQPTSGADISSTNGNVEVRVPQKANLRWVAQTLKGDIMIGGLQSAAGELVDSGGQKTYRAVLNDASGPLVSGSSITGRLYLLPTEKPRSLAASVLPTERTGPEQDDFGRDDYRQIVTTLLIQPPIARTFFIQKVRQPGNLDLTVGLGANVFYAEVEGNAKVTSHGGEVVMARVGGGCTIESEGGGVNLGDIAGPIDVSTAAGDVLVRVARSGGRVTTGGGGIHVLYSGGSMTLESGGGDLTVRQAAGGVMARTESGDIIVTTDPKPTESAPIALTTRGGNIVFEVSPTRGFDIDAEIDADPASASRIESSFSGLTTVREKQGNRVKIRARGRVNGGGTNVTLRARDGNIFIGRVPENRVVFVN